MIVTPESPSWFWCLRTIPSVHLLLLNLPFSWTDSAAVFASTHLCPTPILPSLSPALRLMLPLTSSLFWKYVSPAYSMFHFFFFFPEARGVQNEIER